MQADIYSSQSSPVVDHINNGSKRFDNRPLFHLFHELSRSSGTDMAHTEHEPVNRWSMFPALHDDVVQLLREFDLDPQFHDKDEESCSRTHNTNVMGRFKCHNTACRCKGWSSKKIATTIRLYSGLQYNARVYHQRCKACKSLSRPSLDHSYAERVVYWIKKWNNIWVERPNMSGWSNGPHNRDLCEGCRAGQCSESREDWLSQQLQGFVSF